jgi:hypothetical protein
MSRRAVNPKEYAKMHSVRPLLFAAVLISLFVLLFSSGLVLAAPVLDLRITVSHVNSSLSFLGSQVYTANEGIVVTSNITLDGIASANLAAIEVDSPAGNSCLIRTVKTGNVSKMYFRVQFVDMYTCNQYGTPKTVFNLGESVWVNFTIQNIDVITHMVIVGMYSQGSDNTPLYAYYPEGENISAGSSVQHLVYFPTSPDAPTGQGEVFLSLFTDLPANSGYAYCPEQAANFSLVTSTPAMAPQPDYVNMTFSLPRKNVKLGNYTIHAATNFEVLQTRTDTKQFKVILLGDINNDNLINMRDIAICVSVFQTTPASPNWNPAADVNKDGMVNMRDIGMLVSFFTESAIP